jgi:hypothetical protein
MTSARTFLHTHVLLIEKEINGMKKKSTLSFRDYSNELNLLLTSTINKFICNCDVHNLNVFQKLDKFLFLFDFNSNLRLTPWENLQPMRLLNYCSEFLKIFSLGSALTKFNLCYKSNKFTFEQPRKLQEARTFFHGFFALKIGNRQELNLLIK